jgi:predicted SAM-dependent methyltransferase
LVISCGPGALCAGAETDPLDVSRADQAERADRGVFQLALGKKLHLGASDKFIEGWLNSDIDTVSKRVVYLDATKEFPLPDASLDFVFCEHFIEHIDRTEGEFCLRQVHRCLKPGGVVRIATPNLSKYAALFRDNLAPAEQRHLELFQAKFHLQDINACIALNHLVYNWGHRFLYTLDELLAMLAAAGFGQVEATPVGQSKHTALKGLEQHARFYGEEMNLFETMVVEATKI